MTLRISCPKQTASAARTGKQYTGFLPPYWPVLLFKLGKRINIALENRHTFVKDDLLDGQQWQEHPVGDASLTSNWDSTTTCHSVSNFNLPKLLNPLVDQPAGTMLTASLTTLSI